VGVTSSISSSRIYAMASSKLYLRGGRSCVVVEKGTKVCDIGMRVERARADVVNVYTYMHMYMLIYIYIYMYVHMYTYTYI